MRDRLKPTAYQHQATQANGNDKKDSECPVMSDDFSGC
ncbi:hypothetical protein [Escherichia coli ISC7]|uniref:Uncharacterized protein n=1 Tax=Escherichia coli ISC7 TaxID=1432555 RepID=W1F0Y4_ECOLX|nr:hypothetical protein [Escherichia coli ISC7]